MNFNIEGIGVWGYGHPDWRHYREAATQSNIQSNDPQDKIPLPPPKPEIIPPRERRRAPLAVRIAVEVACQAFEQTALTPADAACVFASSMGDTEITDHMCRTVGTAEKLLSPTKFHNSVHNAAAGYWTISTGCTMAANSVSAFLNSVSIALLESMIQCHSENRPVLLVVFDIQTPEPMRDIQCIEEPFAAAVLLAPESSSIGQKLTAQVSAAAPPVTDMHTLKDEPTNPSARLLPLLDRVAAGDSRPLSFPLGAASFLNVEVRP